jgi:(R,R)-butanediol dehydrogenase/meso-butanediol dehydrogenase/diacetyl reductase
VLVRPSSVHPYADFVGVTTGQGATEARVFVPGILGCGECVLCRRGLPACCPRAVRVGEAGLSGAPFEVPDRFVTLVDEPAGVSALSDELVVLAGLVAHALSAMARAGLGPGDQAVWVGPGPLALIGATLCARRGCRTALLGAVPAGVRPPDDVAALPEDQPLEALAARLAAEEIGPRAERRVFAVSGTVEVVGRALACAGPGTTLSLLEPPSHPLGPLAAIPGGRVLVGPAYHPDFVVEALASLRRDTPISDVAALGLEVQVLSG